VLIDGTQEIYCNVYRSADLPLRKAQANITIISGSPRYGIEALGMILIALMAYSLSLESNGLAIAIPTLGAFALGAQRMLPILQQAYSSWTFMRGGQAFLRDTLELLEQPMPDFFYIQPQNPISFNNEMSFDNISFRYSVESPWVLQGLNLTITKGGRIGFIGITGSGKSTLLDIIMGLLLPVNGGLVIDGVKIDQHNHRSWQAHIAHVPQSIFLSDTSIAENIAFGVPLDEIDYARVRRAAKSAQISDTIELLEQGYDTIVGERGIRLSGGQRQRIGIARALYKQADVIIFDEATSALDNNTELEVMRAIENLGPDLTIIIVAHRLSTLQNCSEVIELANGKISRRGNYEEIVDHV
jgi:ATP-binding cassette subfamily B protein